MQNQQIYEMLQKIIEKEKIFYNEPMSKHTSFKVGGNADFYVKANTISQIQNILQFAKQNNIQLTVIGNGTNLLVKDGGIRGIVLKIDLNNIQINETIITADAGALLTPLARTAMKNSLTGLEFAYGIPGTVGGAIYMNAGAHGQEMKDIVISTTYINENNEIQEITNKEHQFSYRKSIFSTQKSIILQTKIKLEKGTLTEIENKMKEFSEKRKNTQPIEFPSAGSTFKRKDGFITAKAIDECGLKGYKIGGAEVSTKHAGFIINKENATAKDILTLVKHIQQQIKEKYNQNIELEIMVIGED